jgi:predicted TIM-barrel fold metal-dependent hydrolase
MADGRPEHRVPIFEKAQELGVNLIGVHKGVPLGPQPIEHTQTWDMDGAAANFPDINFVIFHVGLPFLDETCWQLIRYPNLYASIAATITSRSGRPGCSRRSSASCSSGAARTCCACTAWTSPRPRAG